MLDYSNLKYIERIQGNYIFLKNEGVIHCHNLNIETQEDLEMEDLEVGRMIDIIKNKQKGKK